MNKFPKDYQDKNCKYFNIAGMNVDDLPFVYDVLCYECDVCDEDYCYLRYLMTKKE